MTEEGTAGSRPGRLPPIGRILGGVAIVTMTLLTFASCGPLKFKGHNLLRNRIDAEDMVSGFGLGGALEQVDPSGMLDGQGEAQSKKSESKPMFEGKDSWLHWVYVAAFAMAVIALFVRARAHLVLGIVGLVLVAVFMVGFDNMFEREMDAEKGTPSSSESSLDVSGLDSLRPSLSWEAGAWLTLLAFAGMGAFGLYAVKQSGGGG